MKRTCFAILLCMLFGIMLSIPAVNGQEDEPELPKVPASLKDREFVLPTKPNMKAKVYFIYQSRYACSICVAEAPEIVKTYKSMKKSKSAELIMLNIDKDTATAAKWAKDVKMKFPIVAPGKAEGIPFPYDGAGLLPMMVAVDAAGNKLGQANGGDVAEFLKTWKKYVREVTQKEKEEAKAAKKKAPADQDQTEQEETEQE